MNIIHKWKPVLRVSRIWVCAGKIEGDPLTVAHLAWAQVHGVISLHLAGKLIMGRSVEDLIDAALPVTETEK